MKELNNLNLTELNNSEKKNITGGSIFLLAFAVGVGYGYVKEKFASGQWEL